MLFTGNRKQGGKVMLLVTKALLYSCTSSSLCAGAAMLQSGTGQGEVTSPGLVDKTPSTTTALVLPTRESGAEALATTDQATQMKLRELLRDGERRDAQRREERRRMEEKVPHEVQGGPCRCDKRRKQEWRNAKVACKDRIKRNRPALLSAIMAVVAILAVGQQQWPTGFDSSKLLNFDFQSLREEAGRKIAQQKSIWMKSALEQDHDEDGAGEVVLRLHPRRGTPVDERDFMMIRHQELVSLFTGPNSEHEWKKLAQQNTPNAFPSAQFFFDFAQSAMKAASHLDRHMGPVRGHGLWSKKDQEIMSNVEKIGRIFAENLKLLKERKELLEAEPVRTKTWQVVPRAAQHGKNKLFALREIDTELKKFFDQLRQILISDPELQRLLFRTAIDIVNDPTISNEHRAELLQRRHEQTGEENSRGLFFSSVARNFLERCPVLVEEQENPTAFRDDLQTIGKGGQRLFRTFGNASNGRAIKGLRNTNASNVVQQAEAKMIACEPVTPLDLPEKIMDEFYLSTQEGHMRAAPEDDTAEGAQQVPAMLDSDKWSYTRWARNSLLTIVAAGSTGLAGVRLMSSQ
ncbi:unnamed protein product [Amoebophrya sp. A120]|nr:unnamed protein product [Amoebophrya sp. A120]|eukprot:GSA120T00019621001.1